MHNREGAKGAHKPDLFEKIPDPEVGIGVVHQQDVREEPGVNGGTDLPQDDAYQLGQRLHHAGGGPSLIDGVVGCLFAAQGGRQSGQQNKYCHQLARNRQQQQNQEAHYLREAWQHRPKACMSATLPRCLSREAHGNSASPSQTRAEPAPG